MLQILVDEDKCIGCGNCYVAHILDLRYCHVCTLCAMECPVDCIKIIRPGEEA